MNKYIFALIAAAAFCIFSSAVYASSGDIAGNFYYTDIVTYMNGAPVTSYNIGDRTVIDADILNWHYGFDVYWHEDARLLEIIDKGGRFHSLQAASGEITDGCIGNPGDIAGDYYKTDITVTLNGKQIESYNVCGKICIVADSMCEFGYNIKWNADSRTLDISKPRGFYKYETDLGTFTSIYRDESSVTGAYTDGGGIFIGGQKLDISVPDSSASLYTRVWMGHTAYIPLKPVLDAIGASYSLTEKTVTYTDTSADGTATNYDLNGYELDVSYDAAKPLPVADKGLLDKTEPVTAAYEITNIDFDLYVNGVGYNMTGTDYHGRAVAVRPFIHCGVIYVPVSTIAQFMGFLCDDGINFK